MSSLVIPGRRTRQSRLKSLLSHLKITSGHLTVTGTGHLAICAGFPQCCLYPDPATVTIAGATGCAAFANGTYALPPDGFPNPPCQHWLRSGSINTA